MRLHAGARPLNSPPCSRYASVETLTCVVMRAYFWDQTRIADWGQNGNHSGRARPSDGKIKAYPNRNSLSSTPARSMARPPERNGSPQLCRQAALSLISASLLRAVTLLSRPRAIQRIPHHSVPFCDEKAADGESPSSLLRTSTHDAIHSSPDLCHRRK